MRLYILRNSGLRVWLADRLASLAGRLNPYEPWCRASVVSNREELVEILTGLTITSSPTEAETLMPAGSTVSVTLRSDGVAELADAILKLATERTLRKIGGREVRRD